MTTSDDQFDDELLSAYVDGELTAAERAQVEDRLRQDPQAAQLVEELRSVSRAVKSLPRETLGRDLRASIRAEIESAHRGDHRQVIPLSEPLDPPRGFRRGFLWSTIAIAAALMIMFLQEQQDAERDVAAVAKKDAADVERVTARNNRRRALAPGGELPQMGEMRSLDESRAAGKPAAGVGGGAGGFAGGTASPPPAAPTAPSPEPGPAESSDSFAFGPSSEQDLALEAGEGESLNEPERLLEHTESVAGASSKLTAERFAESAAAPHPVATVEIKLQTQDGVEQFARLLAENNFQSPSEADTDAVRSRAMARADQPASPTRDLRMHFYGMLPSRDKAADGGEVLVLVEGTPEQVQRLIASCEQAPAVFADVEAPESLARRGAFYRQPQAAGAAPAGPSANSQLARKAEDSDAAPADSAASAARGFAWFLPADDSDAGGTLYGSDREEAKEKAIAPEAEVRLGAELNTREEIASSAPESLADLQQSELSKTAKQLSALPPEGRVRVKFILRPAPQPAAAAATPAPTEP